MDIVERLRAGHPYTGIVDSLDKEAATEIERLRAALTEIATIANIKRLARDMGKD